MADKEKINASEQNSIAKSLLIIINKNYEKLPLSKIEYQSLSTSKSTISLYSLPNSYINKRYINGSFSAKYLFSIVYRSIPTNTNQRISCEEILNELGEWLCNLDFNDYISLTGARHVDEIEITDNAQLYRQYENGTEDYHILFSLKYSKER